MLMELMITKPQRNRKMSFSTSSLDNTVSSSRRDGTPPLEDRAQPWSGHKYNQIRTQ